MQAARVMAAVDGIMHWSRSLHVHFRAHVIGEHGPGIALLDTVVDRRLPALGARLVGMPYRVLRPIALALDDSPSLVTPDLRVTARPLDEEHALRPATLAAFALDRYWLYGRLPGGFAYALRIAHAPWRVRTVEPRVELLCDPLLPSLRGTPVGAHLGDEQEVALVEATAARAIDPIWQPAV